MKYDFNTLIQREKTSSVKYDLRSDTFGAPNVIPMWVADMDFATPPFIINSLLQRLAHSVLGYTFRDEEYQSSIVNWLGRRHGWAIQERWLSFCPGIVAGLNHAIQAFTKPGERVLIQPPVYHLFFHAIRNNKRRLVLNPLVYANGKYAIDFDLLDKQLKSGVNLFILCTPHNPVGRVWSHGELSRVAELCLKYGVTVVSDEIHADLVFAPHRHIPFASLSKEVGNITLTFGSASKTFNLAGLSTAYAVASNHQMLKKYNRQLELNGTDMGNVMGYEATKAAFSAMGEEWLAQLLEYLQGNVSYVREFLSLRLPKVKLVEPEGTYLLWLDFSEYGLSNSELGQKLIHEAGVGLNAGEMFGVQGSGFQRMNIACPRSTIEKALESIYLAFSHSN